ncbi:hypothetical protein LOD99_13997 [Oopsacas minuta]|uniref:EF-hand domain-containing protein n=1 Tax=Oopsacas minuta TaxID=111878 RepID=A0AAV7KG84_9METZ|nr:hypothetical protein LOD99_13997 [Oopsacas minuta]
MQALLPAQCELFLNQYTCSELAEYKQLFGTIDPNNDGYITCNQLKNYLMCSMNHISSEELEEIVNEADLSGCGRITFDNFMQLILNRDLKEKRTETKSVFDSFDLNRDGYIDILDLSAVFFSLNSKDENQIITVFKQLDRNNDGKVDFEEFQEFMDYCNDLPF